MKVAKIATKSICYVKFLITEPLIVKVKSLVLSLKLKVSFPIDFELLTKDFELNSPPLQYSTRNL